MPEVYRSHPYTTIGITAAFWRRILHISRLAVPGGLAGSFPSPRILPGPRMSHACAPVKFATKCLQLGTMQYMACPVGNNAIHCIPSWEQCNTWHAQKKDAAPPHPLCDAAPNVVAAAGAPAAPGAAAVAASPDGERRHLGETAADASRTRPGRHGDVVTLGSQQARATSAPPKPPKMPTARATPAPESCDPCAQRSSTAGCPATRRAGAGCGSTGWWRRCTCHPTCATAGSRSCRSAGTGRCGACSRRALRSGWRRWTSQGPRNHLCMAGWAWPSISSLERSGSDLSEQVQGHARPASAGEAALPAIPGTLWMEGPAPPRVPRRPGSGSAQGPVPLGDRTGGGGGGGGTPPVQCARAVRTGG
eukprot:gene10688-biopygen13864